MGYEIGKSSLAELELEASSIRLNSDEITTKNNSLSSLSENFFPALFGIHENASASISYSQTTGLPTSITWTSSGNENVGQTISYENDKPKTIVTEGAGSGDEVTETLTWDGDELTSYSISIVLA